MGYSKITDRNIMLGLTLVLATSLTAYFIIMHHITEYNKYGYISHIFLPLIGASSFFVGGFIALMFHWGIDEIKFNSVLKLLPENERMVMELLYERKSLSQHEITALTEMSRVKTSRAISSLADKGVLDKYVSANSNIIASRLYRTNPSSVVTKLPGLSEKRIILGFGLVFLLGVFISVLNSIHVIELNHPLKPSNYIFSAESLALGGLIVMFLRNKISRTQVEKTLSVLPPDYMRLLKILIEKKEIAQMDLVEATGLNKMKISRLIFKLAQTGLIDKKSYGNTNLIISKL